MEIRLHALHGMHFIMCHYDHPIQKRSLSSAHKNAKTIAERLQKCPLTVKSVFEKIRLQMPPPLKKTGRESLFWGEGCVCNGDRRFHWIHVEGRSNRTKNIPLQKKAYEWGKGRIYAPLLFALNNTNSHSSIVSFLPALSQLKLA